MSESMKRVIMKRDKEIEDLKVLIDTLQTNLRSAVQLLDDKSTEQITGTPSYKWCVNWRPENS